jgi:hypothetical protein
MTETEEAERRLGRAVAMGLPLAGGAATVVVAVTTSFGSAILVLASTALLSTIALLWASLRTLSGDAPLPAGIDETEAPRSRTDALTEKKRQVLRALKDLETERDLGKIDAADYADVAARYRAEAKDILREMEAEVAPAMQAAEKLARDYLAKHAGPMPTTVSPGSSPRASVAPAEDRLPCGACGAANERDAAFCKMCGAKVRGREEQVVHAKA